MPTLVHSKRARNHTNINREEPSLKMKRSFNFLEITQLDLRFNSTRRREQQSKELTAAFPYARGFANDTILVRN